MVTVSGYRGRVWLGRVLQVSSGSGEPAGLEQGARGVEVQIGLDSAQGRGQLPGGLTADVAIDTRAIPSVLPTTPEAPGPAASRPPRSSPAAGEPSDPQLTQIGEQERRILAQLNAESEQIHKIIVGAAPGAHGGVTPSFLNDGLAWPVSGTVSSGYGWRIHPIFHTPEFHTGIDIATPWGAPVEAADGGVVIFTGQMTANGKLIIVDHGNGLSTMYSHLSSYDVHAGDRVRRGETIGRVGSTGWSTGPHLFFELRRDGQPLDPIEP